MLPRLAERRRPVLCEPAGSRMAELRIARDSVYARACTPGWGREKGQIENQVGVSRQCGSAWNKDPISGVIGVQTGPL
jgi:hypothetical protein